MFSQGSPQSHQVFAGITVEVGLLKNLGEGGRLESGFSAFAPDPLTLLEEFESAPYNSPLHQVQCDAFGHLVVKFGGPLWRFLQIFGILLVSDMARFLGTQTATCGCRRLVGLLAKMFSWVETDAKVSRNFFRNMKHGEAAGFLENDRGAGQG